MQREYIACKPVQAVVIRPQCLQLRNAGNHIDRQRTDRLCRNHARIRATIQQRSRHVWIKHDQGWIGTVASDWLTGLRNVSILKTYSELSPSGPMVQKGSAQNCVPFRGRHAAQEEQCKGPD